MASTTEIVNAALTLLGEGRVLSIDDNVKAARDAKAIYGMTLRSLLGGYTWSFAKTRAQIPALASAPAFQFSHQYQIPSDCLRLVMVGDTYVGVDLTDYRGSPVDEYVIEDGKILTDLGAPLNIKYIKYVDDPNAFSPNFVMALSAKLADFLAEPLTQSDAKRQRAIDEFNKQIRIAVRAGAIELPPQKLADDEWVVSRL